jgi:SAM-dependent methyltransferase
MARSRSWWRIVGVALVGGAAGGWLIVTRLSAASVRSESAQIVTVLGLREGSRVADVGAGEGTYALELARLVGPTSHVFATEIDSKRRRQIRSAATSAGLQHLSVVEAREVDTGLERGCCDGILMRGVYHHVTRPVETNGSLYQALRSGGRLAVLDFPPGWFLSTFFRVNGVPANRGGHGVPPEVVIEELRTAGFRLERRIDKWDGRLYCLAVNEGYSTPTNTKPRPSNLTFAIDGLASPRLWYRIGRPKPSEKHSANSPPLRARRPPASTETPIDSCRRRWSMSRAMSSAETHASPCRSSTGYPRVPVRGS